MEGELCSKDSFSFFLCSQRYGIFQRSIGLASFGFADRQSYELHIVVLLHFELSNLPAHYFQLCLVRS